MSERRITPEIRNKAVAYSRRFVGVRVFAFLLLHILALAFLNVVARTLVLWLYGAAYAVVEYRRIANEHARKQMEERLRSMKA